MLEQDKLRFKVTHIDDDPDILGIAKTALEALGPFEVSSFSSGPAALEQLPSIRPKLILLDLSMPEMDGRETFQCIRKIPDLEKIPILFLTAVCSPAVRNELLALGAVAVLAKPFDLMLLSAEISKHIESLEA